MIKKSTLTIITVLAIIYCLYSMDASAATNNIPVSNSSVSIGLVIVVLLALGIVVFKTASKNLKRVNKHLEDSFGEKVLP